jgi:hypothetical protein
MTKLKIRDVFRYARPYTNRHPMIDGLPNHFSVTDFYGSAQVLLERGINPMAAINAVDGKRVPAIVIRSSPHKIGSETTPWQDVFDVDNGYIRYYGDNKEPGKNPSLAPGNKALLRAYELYNDATRRHLSIPLTFYKSVIYNKQAKGYIEFNGFGIIKEIDLVTQYDRKQNATFSNFAFVFQVFSLSSEHEKFDWQWINDRRNPQLSLDDTMRSAPASWKDWVRFGPHAVERNRRRVSKLMTLSKSEQVAVPGSKEEKTVNTIYDYYFDKKARFEGLASTVTAKIMNDAAEGYSEGWITPPSSDGGADFYGRLEIGRGFGKAKMILLGQAKCEKPDSPTGGNHIARTVARLRRGWVGVYVTTSFFSEAVQREIIEDEYPIMLINGRKLAETVLKILHDDGHSHLEKFLEEIDSKYDGQVRIRRPEELLFE